MSQATPSRTRDEANLELRASTWLKASLADTAARQAFRPAIIAHPLPSRHFFPSIRGALLEYNLQLLHNIIYNCWKIQESERERGRR